MAPCPHPGWFLAKSAETIENKGVEFFVSAKKCKRVCKSVKGKGIDRKELEGSQVALDAFGMPNVHLKARTSERARAPGGSYVWQPLGLETVIFGSVAILGLTGEFLHVWQIEKFGDRESGVGVRGEKETRGRRGWNLANTG
jgi:hypothetical protein